MTDVGFCRRVFTNAPPTDEDQREFERQLEIMVNEHKSHPSIITWVIYNEGWGQRTDYFPEFELTDRVRELDPTRLIDATSGWIDHGAVRLTYKKLASLAYLFSFDWIWTNTAMLL